MPQDENGNEMLSERRHLVSLAYRMLGTIPEAEEAVQETYLRWYKLPQHERDQIAPPQTWMTRVISRVCLARLSTAKARHARYVGPWLPEPVPNSAFGHPNMIPADASDRITMDDSISTALLVVLEAMPSGERIAFVLHEIFAVPLDEVAMILRCTSAEAELLAAFARVRVEASRNRRDPRAEHDRVVKSFAHAIRANNLPGLMLAMDSHVVLQADGGGVVTAARNPIVGADRVARFLLGIVAKSPGSEILEQDTPDGLGFALWDEGRITGVVTLDVMHGLVSDVRMVVNPGKLSLWNRPSHSQDQPGHTW
ncbi:sigma factor [Microbacterium yannicii]|uniref:sigma factor n=1 Tax=Microbacterium yannicii TaxID=671622 RepID=UPI0003806434|nr:sigma factor [Microbacterium yannicii]